MSERSKGKLAQAAATLGSAGGKKGGPARAKVLTSAQRSKIAKMGAEARHRKKKHGTTGAI